MKTADGLSVWAESRADARLDWTAGILRGLDMHAVDHVTLSDRIDRVLLHPVIGVLVFLAVLFVVFQATTTLASPMQDWIDVTFRGWCADGLDLLLGLFGPSVSGGWLRSLLVDGLLDGVVTVLTFIPVMGIMFLLLSILEDSGYMARAAFVMDRAMRALGLDGRAFLPIIVGFGAICRLWPPHEPYPIPGNGCLPACWCRSRHVPRDYRCFWCSPTRSSRNTPVSWSSSCTWLRSWSSCWSACCCATPCSAASNPNR